MSKGVRLVLENDFRERLHNAYQNSLEGPFLWMLYFDDFIHYQTIIKQLLGNTGFVMYTEKRAVLCLKKAPDLQIYLIYSKYFSKENFQNLCFDNIEIIGKGKKELPNPIKQYFIDIKDNFLKVILVTFIYFSIFNFEKINVVRITSLSDNLINAISIFTGIVFVFIGFIYSDKEKAISIFIKGCGDKYYRIDRYIMNLSIISLFILIFVSALGGLTSEDIPQFLMNLQDTNLLIDKIVSYRSQYYICIIMTWFSLCSMVICFTSLIDYYLNDLRNSFFIDAVRKKSKER